MTNQQGAPEAPHHTKYLTAVYRDIKPGDEARELIMHPKMTAASWSHVMNERDCLQAENANLRTGYAAARLEIESLQARIKTMAEEHADELMVAHLDGRMRAEQPAGEYPALPEPVGKVEVSTTLEKSGLRRHKASPAYTSDQRRDYVDRAMRVAQPAGAQQPKKDTK